jgi:hypothetical protein
MWRVATYNRGSDCVFPGIIAKESCALLVHALAASIDTASVDEYSGGKECSKYVCVHAELQRNISGLCPAVSRTDQKEVLRRLQTKIERRTSLKNSAACLPEPRLQQLNFCACNAIICARFMCAYTQRSLPNHVTGTRRLMALRLCTCTAQKDPKNEKAHSTTCLRVTRT